ncbi:MAG: sodium:solute symporter family protein [Candidatus Fimivivens sp.]
MNKTVIYLIYFCIYSAILLAIGKNSFRKGNTKEQFYLGGRRLSFGRCVLTFCGTWVSAATILGFTGSVFESGYAALIYSVIPWFIGAVLLVIISDRLYDNDILTIPEFFRKRFGSKTLQVIFAIIMIGVYVFYLVIQIRGFGLVAATLFNIPYVFAISLIYLFILYATFGGYHTVAKTDAFNLLVLSLGLLMVFVVIVTRAGGISAIHEKAAQISGYAYSAMPYPTDKGALLHLFGKGNFAPLMSATMFFGWGLGLAANPQYTIRMLSAKDKRTAKRTVLCAMLYLALLYFALLQIGLGMRVMFPTLDTVQETDGIFVHVINNLAYGPWSGFFLFSIIGACISTANSQLLLIASSFSYDIVSTLRKKPLGESTLLALSRTSIFVGGTVSLLLSIHPPASLLTYGGDLWGIFSVTMFPTLYGSLLFSRTTRQGVWAGLGSGLLCLALFYPPYLTGGFPFHPAFPGTVVATLSFLTVSHLTYDKNHPQSNMQESAS